MSFSVKSPKVPDVPAAPASPAGLTSSAIANNALRFGEYTGAGFRSLIKTSPVGWPGVPYTSFTTKQGVTKPK